MTAKAESLIRPFMPELDTLRGIAVLGVLFLHGFEWQYGGMKFGRWSHLFILATQPGWMGVNLFFVLSGFLITGILLKTKTKPGYYRSFYFRRILRILPPYYLLLIVLGVLHQASKGFIALSFFYLSNLTSFFGVTMDYGPLWSLAVEEHFYIVWPGFVRNVRRSHLAILAGAICLAVPLGRAICFRYWHGVGIDWYTWFVADGLAMGSILAILLRSTEKRNQLIKLSAFLILVSAIFSVAGAPFGILTRQRLLGATFQYTLVSLFFSGFLIMFLLVGTSAYKRYVNSRVLQFLGYISYGLYLFHLMLFRIYDSVVDSYWPRLLPSAGHFGLVVLRFIVAGGAAIGLAYLSRRYFEENFLRLKSRLPLAPEPHVSG